MRILNIVRRFLRALGLEVRHTENGLLLSSTRLTLAKSGSAWFWSKLQQTDIDNTLLFVSQKWMDQGIILLTDEKITNTSVKCTILQCGTDPVARILEFDHARSIFVYACNSDSIGLPYIKEVVSGHGVFYPVQVYQPSSYFHINDTARKVVEYEYKRQTAEKFCKFDFGPGDALNLAQAIAITSRTNGDYVEIGCFRGSSACVALSYMRAIGLPRRCFFLDVFEGFTYQVARDSPDIMWADTHGTEGLETVKARILECSATKKGLFADVIKSNIICDDLPEQIADIALANIDVDLYEAVSAALLKVAPKMAVGGIIIVEDPGHTPALIGSRLALEEFLSTPIASCFTPIYLESGQTFLIKRSS